MAVELRNRLREGLGLDTPLPASLVFDYPTVDALIQRLTKRCLAERSQTGEPGPGAVGSDGRDLLGEVEALTDEEVDQYLQSRLGEST